MTGVEARKLDRDSLDDGKSLQAISLTRQHQQKVRDCQSVQPDGILTERQRADLANMVYLTNSDLAESLKLMSIPPKTIEIHLTENETNINEHADESKLTEQHKNSSQAMMKSATPM